MGKQLCMVLLLSLLYCLPVFGEEPFLVQENIEQKEENSTFYQDKQIDTQGDEKIFYAGTNALDKIASIIAHKNGRENSSITFTQEIQSVDIGPSSAGLKEAAETQPKPQGNRWGISLSPEEIDLLARIVMLEAGGESPLGQQAVTEVIFNRMVSPYYGGSLEHVLSAQGQFSTWKKRFSAQATPTPQVIASVTAVLHGETNILPFQTLYFSRRPQNRRVQTQIGGHTFCNQ